MVLHLSFGQFIILMLMLLLMRLQKVFTCEGVLHFYRSNKVEYKAGIKI
jgi:hypothetical protein